MDDRGEGGREGGGRDNGGRGKAEVRRRGREGRGGRDRMNHKVNVVKC